LLDCEHADVGYDFRRASLAALCVLAVVLGATLFPSTGFGAAPSDKPAIAPGVSQPSTPAGPSTPASTPTPEPRDTATPTPTDTPEPDDTPTDTPASEDGDDSDDSSSLLWFVVGSLGRMFVASLVVFVVVGFTGAFLWFGAGDGDEENPLDGFLSRIPLVRRFVTPSLAQSVQRIPQVTMTTLIGFSTSTAGVLSDLGNVASEVAAGAASVASGGTRSAGSLFAGAGRAFVAVPLSLSLSAGSALTVVPNALSRLAGGVKAPGTETALTDDDARDASGVEPDPATEDDGPFTIEDAWQTMVERLPVRNPRATTATEYARAAIDAGLPREPVERLTRVFQEVKYGGRPRESRRDVARDAASQFRQFWEDDD
jgi:hypothetical protein